MKLQYKPSMIEPGTIRWKKCKEYALSQIGVKAKDALNAQNAVDSAEQSLVLKMERLMTWKTVLRMMEAMEGGYSDFAIEWPEPELPFVTLSVTEKKD